MFMRRLVSAVLWGVACVALLSIVGPALAGRAGLYIDQYTDRYYAFYLDTGEVVYGKIRAVGWGSVTVRDAYSFRTIEVGETSTNNLQAQRQNLLTAPDNWLTLRMSHVLLYERMGKDARALELMRASQ